MAMHDMHRDGARLMDQRGPLERTLAPAQDQAALAAQRRKIHQVAGVGIAPRRQQRYHVVRLGPLECAEGPTSMYLVASGRRVLGTIPADDDADGLARVLAAHGDRPRTCAPDLVRTGRKLGFTAGEVPRGAARLIAAIACRLHNRETVHDAPMLPAAIDAVLNALGAFMRAQPWRMFGDEHVIDLTMRAGGGRPRAYQASVMGAAGQEHGLSVHEGADGLERFLASVARTGLPGGGMFSVSLDDEPAWAIELVRDPYGIPGAPRLLTYDRDGHRVATLEDLVVLAGALAVVVALSPYVPTASVLVPGLPFDLPPLQVDAHTTSLHDLALTPPR